MNVRSLFWGMIGICLSSVINAQTDDLFASYKWRNIGPANQGGRVVDIEAVRDDFRKVFVATGTGGLWKSANAGTTWTPVFDTYETSSIGDVAIFQGNSDIIWVGTGEANNRNSLSWGNGVYVSHDGGESFENKGLQNTHHIGRVIIHPTNPDVVYVAAVGHLWGYSGDRGLFKTEDSGVTWTKLSQGLPDDGKTGCTDLVMDPGDPNTLYAAFYHRRRQPWTFYSGGPDGGIFKTRDGGKTWQKLANGLPEGETGRIGLAIYEKDPRIVMALVEAKQTGSLDTPGSGVYRSEDGGRSWTYVNTYNNRPFYYSQIRINPHDDQRVYLLTTRFMVSDDGGKTLRNGSEDQEVHGDFHAMWIDPADPDRYYLGADKGMNITFDHGEHFIFLDNLPLAQFYRIGVDHRDPYYIYGGLQDNGSYAVASFSRDARGILSDSNWKLHWGDGQYAQIDPADYRNFYTSSENGNIMRYDPVTHRISNISPSPRNIANFNKAVPESEKGTNETLRFNWTSPMWMSPHDPSTIYVGGNYLFKTTDAGQNWWIISPDLSTNHPEKRKEGESGGVTPDNTGAETHCAISTLGLSPVNPSVIWVGTDDGNVQLTTDGGASWTNVRSNIPGVPDEIWVSRIEAGHFSAAVAYVTFDGHRSDVFDPFIFKTEDYGKTWTSIRSNLPDGEVIRVVREDLRNPDLLFIGTEYGVWVSRNGGDGWSKLANGMPTVPVLDLLIHPRDRDLIAGTHGRGIYILDDITALEMLPLEISKKSILFEQRQATLWQNVSRGGQRGHFWFAGENPDVIENTSSMPRAGFVTKARITYYTGANLDGPAILTIEDNRGNVKSDTVDSTPGIHRYLWDFSFDPKPYTGPQLAKIEEVFQELLKESASGFLRNRYQAFQRAGTPAQQRAAVAPLTGPISNFALDESYGMPGAGPGSYILTLTVDGESQQQTLYIREDPILNR